MKLGLGIGSWLCGEWLGISGYTSLATQFSSASHRIVMLVSFFPAWLGVAGYSPLPTQSPSAVHGIVVLISILPAVALVLGFVALFIYPINERLEQQMRGVLRERRESSS
jgi:Na+/melibiose symporter-like transporter